MSVDVASEYLLPNHKRDNADEASIASTSNQVCAEQSLQVHSTQKAQWLSICKPPLLVLTID